MVLDSGINANHAAFTGRVVPRGFVQNNPTCSTAEKTAPIDMSGHGTHVAGIISSAGTSLLPNLRGVAYGLGTLYAAKIGCGNFGGSPEATLEAAQNFYATFNISIVNYSLGIPTVEDDDLFSRLIDILIDMAQLIWITAAGNDGPTDRTVNSPATAYNGISVANFDANGAAPVISKDSDSSRGPTIGGRKKPDIGAPGTNINSTSNIGSLFRTISGTSMAAPHIAGAAALLRQAGVRSPLAMKALLLNTTDTTGWTPSGGYGFADIERAFSQRELIAQGTFASARDSVRLYKTSVPANSWIYGTLVWNRHFTSNRLSMLRDLNLSLYDRPTGQLTSISDSTIDNVEVIAASNGNPTPRDVIVTVVANGESNGIQEPFALASSHQLQQINGPFFAPNCQQPAAAPANSSISIACTVANQGDLEALETIVTLSSGGTIINPATPFGAIYPGQSVTRTFSIRTGASGSMPIQLKALGNGFGVFRQDFFDFTLNISTAAPTCSFTLSANSATLPATGGTATVNVATQAGCNWSAGSLPSWLTLASPSTFSGSGTLSVTAQTNSSTAERSHSLVISGQAFTVRQLSAPQSRRPVIQAVTDAANSGIMISSGAWISIFGTDLAKSTRTWASTDFSGRFLPTRLDGTTVSINGRSAYISYISPSQINALVPDDPQTGWVQIVVSTSEGQSIEFLASKQPASPAFFALPSGNTRFAAATHPDGALVAPVGLFPGATSRPARRGGTITLYATGCGPTTPSTPAGEVVASPATLGNAVRISADNIALPILYAGVVGSGLCQFNVTLPASLPGGNVALTLQIDSFRSVLSVVVPIL